MPSRNTVTILAFLAFGFVVLAGSAMADTRSTPHQYLHFALGDVDSLFIQNSSGGTGPEVAEIPFSLHFSDEAPTGIMTKIKIRIDFDPAYLQYGGVTPTAQWPGTIDEDPQAHDTANGVICLEFVGAPDVPIPTTSTQYATILFEARCQEELSENYILFDRSSNDNFVDTYDEGSYSHSPQHWNDGTITIADYHATFDIGEVPGLLGDVGVTVPITSTTNFNMVGVYHVIEYDFTKLTFVEGEVDSIAFPVPSGFCQFNETEPGHLVIVVRSNSAFWTPPLVEEQELYYLKFDVKPDHEGTPNDDDCTAAIDFVDYEASATFVYCREGALTWCFDLYFCVDPNDFTDGGIDIPAYLAALRSEYQGDYIVRTDGSSQLTFDVSMLNSFPAGDYSDLNGDGGVDIVFDLPEYFTPLDLIEEPNGPDFHSLWYSNGERVLYTYQEYNASTENYWAPTTESVNLYEEIVLFNESLFEPDYANRTIELAFRDEFVSGQLNWQTCVEDTTGTIGADSANGKLSWESIPVEVKMGEFSTDYILTDERHVYQPLYIRANFDIGTFSVDVNIDGAADIVSVAPEVTGVEYLLISDTEVRIYYDGSSTFHAATGDDDLLIATIHYYIDCMAATGKIAAAKAFLPIRPWVPHDVEVDVSFDDEDIHDDGAYNHFVALRPNGFKSTYCNEGSSYKEGVAAIPNECQLHRNYPNPFNPETIIAYDVPASGHVRMDVYNILGEKVRNLVDDVKGPGTHEVLWDSSDDKGNAVASGIYFYHMQVGTFSESKKMILLR